jgi:hypothetical protein
MRITVRRRQKSAFLVFSRAWGKAVDNPVTKKNSIRRSFCLQIGPVCMMFGLGSSAAHRAPDLPDAEAYEGTATVRDRRAHQVLDDVARLSQQHNGSGQDLVVAGNKRCRNQPSAVRENQAATGVPLRGPNKEREQKSCVRIWAADGRGPRRPTKGSRRWKAPRVRSTTVAFASGGGRRPYRACRSHLCWRLAWRADSTKLARDSALCHERQERPDIRPAALRVRFSRLRRVSASDMRCLSRSGWGKSVSAAEADTGVAKATIVIRVTPDL